MAWHQQGWLCISTADPTCTSLSALSHSAAGLGIRHTPTGAFTQPTQPVPPLHPMPRRLLPTTQAYAAVAFPPTQQAYMGPQMLQLQPQLQMQLQPPPPQHQACPYPQPWQQVRASFVSPESLALYSSLHPGRQVVQRAACATQT